MDIKPDWDKLIGGLKSLIVDIIGVAVGMVIGIAAADRWFPPHGLYWFMTTFVVFMACQIVLWLLQRAWSRWRTAQKGPM